MKRRIVKKYMHRMPTEVIDGRRVKRIALDVIPKRLFWECMRQLAREGKLAIMNQ